MILFSEIFNRAIRLFDDPDINRLYVGNPVAFAKKMRPFLINGLGKFSNPTTIASLMSQQDEPNGKIEIFDGTGTDVYTLSTVPVDNAEMVCMIEGHVDLLAQYDSETNSVTFSKVVEEGQECSVEWYYAGAFTANLDGIGGSGGAHATAIDQVKNILAHCLLLSWSEQSKNFLLDIRNWLQDTDFKLFSPAHSIESKVKWYNNVESGLNDLMNALGWTLRTRATYAKGGTIIGR